MTIRVFRYWCKPPRGEDLRLVEAQLRLAAGYRKMLWHLAIASRALYRQRRREFFPELSEVEEQLARQSEIFKLLDSDTPKKEKQALKVEVQRLRAKLRELREAAKESKEFNDHVTQDRERENVLKKAIRGAFSAQGLYSGTYICIEDADKRARKGNDDPREPRFDGSGQLAIQLQLGRSVADIFSGRDPSIAIAPPNRIGRGRRSGSYTTARYRVCSVERKARCIPLQLLMHRDLPPDAKITWAKLVRARGGADAQARGKTRFIYSLQLTVESDFVARKRVGAGIVAVCFNKDKITFQGDGDAEEQTISFETHHKTGEKLGAHLPGLQAVRDKNMNHAFGLLKAWVERTDEVPEWLLDELENLKSCRRGIYVLDLMHKHKYKVHPKVWEELRKWRRQENHLYQWWRDSTVHCANYRKHAFRTWAASMAAKYRHIVLDNRRFDIAEARTADRNLKSFGNLRLALKQAFTTDYVTELSDVSPKAMLDAYFVLQREKANAAQCAE